ncbi:TetR/AcrR family transcriptional regulator [Nocardioides sp. Kera G14]|uniref:TetR/AcrR family transcriptional regulator n=1 Tax=Nocardioides sp. Kera G14 TaxID=2884264 RepID=UPI001D114A26|nr:TetR/AcrR family transcriptional regulator [Nocardioides sp. Kera G14]UDY23658.1 TetR/AcrR family transcriptional regulator [Nocardioides sp. Kera G14]
MKHLRPGRPRRDVDDVVRAALVDLVRRQGYAGTTIDQVARAAGVAKTTVYRRWESKTALALDALIDVLGEPPVADGPRETGLGVAIGWLAGRISDPDVHHLLTALIGEAARDAEIRLRLRGAIRTPFERRTAEAWALDPASVDLAFDVAVGALLHHAAMTGRVEAATVALISDLAVRIASA